MTVERAIRLMAGIMILLSLGLAQLAGQVQLGHLSWLWLTAFIGINLLQSSLTGFCPPEFLFKKLGLKQGNGGCG